MVRQFQALAQARSLVLRRLPERVAGNPSRHRRPASETWVFLVLSSRPLSPLLRSTLEHAVKALLIGLMHIETAAVMDVAHLEVDRIFQKCLDSSPGACL